MTHLYFDKEMEEMEKKIKNFFPDFNRSNFYRQSLVDFINNNFADVDELKKKVEEEKKNQADSKQREKHFQSLIDNFSEREKQKVSMKKQRERLSKKQEKELLATTINNINTFYPKINKNFSSDKVLSLAKDFVKQWTEDKNNRLPIFDFMEARGYPKEEQKIEVQHG